MAVLPTPGSPMSTGLFLVRRREHLHDPLGLAGAADDRVELLVAGELGEVAAELVEHERARRGVAGGAGAGGGLLAGLLRLTRGARVAREQLDDLLADTGQVGAQLHEHLGGDALALTDEAEEDVLGADVVVAELQRLAQRQLEHLLGAGREGDVARRRRAALADDLLDLAAHGLERDAERLERLGGDALALVDEPEQDVLGADVVVVEEACLLLGQHDDPAGPVGEAFEQGAASQRWCEISVTPGDDIEFPRLPVHCRPGRPFSQVPARIGPRDDGCHLVPRSAVCGVPRPDGYLRGRGRNQPSAGPAVDGRRPGPGRGAAARRGELREPASSPRSPAT